MAEEKKKPATGRKKPCRSDKITPWEEEQIKAIYAVTGNYSETARQVGRSMKAVMNVIKGRTGKNINAGGISEDVLAARDQWRKEFIRRAWANISKANELLEKKLALALDESESMPETLKEMNMRELASTMGTLYDKAALAEGAPTERIEMSADTQVLLEGVSSIYHKLKGGDGDGE